MGSLNEIVDRMSDVRLIEQALQTNGVPQLEISLYLLGRNLVKGIKREVADYILLIMEDSPTKVMIGKRMQPEFVVLELATTERILSVIGDEESLNFFTSMKEEAEVLFGPLKSKGGQRSGKR